MVDPSDLKITSIKRTCIACPVTWFGGTGDGGSWYVRLRGGRFSLRYMTSEPKDDKEYVSSEYEIYNDTDFDSFEGHMDVYELKNKLEGLGVSFDDVLPSTFYENLDPSECDFLVLGDWFNKASCKSCDYSIKPDSVEKIQFETVIPKECPVCSSELTVETEKPRRLENWSDEES